MATYKILISDGLDESGKTVLRSAGDVADLDGISAENLLVEIADCDALIVRGRTKVTPAVFAAGKKLKVVGRAGIGVDNIDLNAAKTAGVAVVNSPLATTITVAELALAMMLAMARELPRADASMKAGKWLKKDFEGIELYGKTLGVIGYGRIGAAVAKRAAAFDMHILGFDLIKPADEIRKEGGEPVGFEELLARSDFITLHLPLTPQTRNMLNAEVFQKMKTGVYIVDAARGGVIDETALLAALNSGKVGGAALDVFSAEPPGLTALVAHPRLVATPHIGAQTLEAQARAGYDISTEIVAALKGEPLRWRVA
jgi:D-3-phosphoglycerate dehydrogenase / 2-oxoglutarate reductase